MSRASRSRCEPKSRLTLHRVRRRIFINGVCYGILSVGLCKLKVAAASVREYYKYASRARARAYAIVNYRASRRLRAEIPGVLERYWNQRAENKTCEPRWRFRRRSETTRNGMERNGTGFSPYKAEGVTRLQARARARSPVSCRNMCARAFLFWAVWPYTVGKFVYILCEKICRLKFLRWVLLFDTFMCKFNTFVLCKCCEFMFNWFIQCKIIIEKKCKNNAILTCF